VVVGATETWEMEGAGKVIGYHVFVARKVLE
jgi:hypothetical protein